MQADRQPALPGTPASLQLSALSLQVPEVPDHELLCLIGQGSFGEVWLARNAIGTLRAVKIVHRLRFERSEDFEREFKGLLRFEPISRSHDGLVDILQIGRRDDAGYFFYVMELADSVISNASSVISNQDSATASREETSSSMADETTACGRGAASDLPASPFVPLITAPLITDYSPRTLRSELQARGRLAPDQCVAIALKLTAALEHLHASGLVHRDIKPSNIIFVNGEPKLADIGLVTAIDEAHSMVGTVGYIPPEGPGTPQADIYSLGKVLYEIALGKDRRDFPQLPPDLPSQSDYAALLELNEIILRACESDPRGRYKSAAEMGIDLALLHVGKSVKSKRARERHWASAKKLGLAAMTVILFGTALWFWQGQRRVNPPDPELMRLYDRGHWHHSQLNAEDMKKAVKYLNQVLQIDPRFVPAYVDLFEIYIWTFRGVAATREEQLTKQREIADRLLAIDGNLAEGHAALSYCKYLERDWLGAEEEIKRAIRLNPNYPMGHSLYGYYLSLLGRTDEALREVQRGAKLDSASSRITALITWYPYMASRQFDEAIKQLKSVIELDGNFLFARIWLGRCYEAQSNYLAALKEYEKADLVSGEDLGKTKDFYDAWRQAHELRGEQGYWEKKLEDLEPDSTSGERGDSRLIAGCYAKLGEKEKALKELEENFDHMAVWNALKFEPMFDSLHDEPRFKKLLKRAGFE